MPPPSSDAVSFKVSRHDHHNLEVKLAFAGDAREFQARSELFLFLPSTMRVSAYEKSDLMLDFTSRLRLSLPSDRCAASLKRLCEDCQRLLAGEAQPPVEAIQNLGAIAGEALKTLRRDHRKRLAADSDLASLAGEIQETAESVETMRGLLRERELPYLSLLADYIGHLYVRYLADLHSTMRGRRGVPRVLREVLSANLEKAAGETSLTGLATDEARELHLVRIGQLKKFFHANLFIDVSRNHVNRKFKEPAAAAAAAAAALWAGYFQQFQNPQAAGLGLGGASVLSLGVAAYVIKDRMKETAKNFLSEKASRYFPDMEQDLTARDRPLGRIREWFQRPRSAKVPREVRELRESRRLSFAESHLAEEILHHAKQYRVRWKEGSWALQESLRLNLERYLKHMDDPYKDFTVLTPAGGVEKVRAHRVYHFFLVVKTEVDRKTHRLEAFRVVMDKSGIQRVEPATSV